MAQCERKKAARWINDKTQRDYSGRHKQKSPARWRGLNLFGRRLKLWRQYQIYIKYMLISSFMQYIADNLLLFAVNVIVQRDVALGSLVSYTVWSLRRNAPRNFGTSLFC